MNKKSKKNCFYNKNDKFQINYFFFGFLFLLLVCTHIYHICLISSESFFERSYFVAYAVSELFLEITILILTACLIRAYLPKLLTSLFILCTFFLFISHLLDFPLVRLMDMSIWFALTFVKNESYQNFIEMLYASNISMTTWLIGGIISISAIMLGIFLFRCSEKMSNKYPVHLSYRTLTMPIWVIPIVLCAGDLMTKSFSSSPKYDHYLRTLPWKTTLLPPARNALMISSPLKSLHNEDHVLEEINKIPSISDKPNIYLFVIESLREDFITPETAPNFSVFRNENTSFKLAFSNSNATQISWFSLFYSKFPFYWSKFQSSSWESGSIPLNILKQMGYRINVYSSARLGYYQMDEMMFGKRLGLLDSYHVFSNEDEEIYKRDQKTVYKLCKDIAEGNKTNGNVFIIFLDSTHFDYSWPKENMTRFAPCEEAINYFKAATTYENLDSIKNRYRNSIYYVDFLFGKFVQELKKTNGWQDAIVVMTGDHGEEFYEQGHLFHASNLSHPQMHVPLYYKFGDDPRYKNQTFQQMTSHMDIFPSIFNFILKDNSYADLFEGESIFNSTKWPFAIIARYNASHDPYEFAVHNGTCKVIARFKDENEIFKSQHLHIISTRTLYDESVPYSMDYIKENFGKAFDRIFAP